MSGLLFAGQTAPLLANPTGGDVVAGAATMGSAGSTLTVNQSTQNAIINWQQFSIASGETTKFVVPNLGATLNRVVGGNPSAIYGTLQSNGTLYLVNPSGIVVGASGRIDTASFLASTLDVSNEQFLKGGALNFAGASDAAINNNGTIHAATGDVYLIANQVNNNGTLSAPQGTVGLAAGNDVIFQQAGSQNLFVQATPAGTKRALGVTNAGTIHAAAAELTAAGGNAYALAINNTGVIAATGYKKINGQVYLTSNGGSIANSGKISAKQANGNGGTIVVDGTAKNSSTSGTVTNSGTLNASATTAGGNGGTISLKNLGGAVVHSGKLLARGGMGGRGGNAEISGATVGFTGAVDLRSLNGTTGNLLLDPATVNIVTGGGSNLSAATIAPASLVAALDGANVTLTGTTSITVTNLVDASGNGSQGNLTLTTPKLTLNAPIILSSGSVLSGSATTLTVGAGGSVQNAVDAASSTTTPTIALASGATYELTSQIYINKSLTLNGNTAILDGSNGAGAGNGVTRVMEVAGTSSGVTVNLNNVKLENGNSVDSNGDDQASGGGLLVYGYNGLQATVNLTNSTVSGNTSGYDGGGIYEDGQYGSATLTVTGSTITDNTAGVYHGTGNGGGIANSGYQGTSVLTLSANSTLNGNSDSFSSAGIYNTNGTLNLGKPGDTTFTVNDDIFNDGGATMTVAPSVTTVTVNAPVTNANGSITNSSATTVNVSAGSGLENGLLVQGGVNLVADGGTVKLTAGTTYNLDATTSQIVIGHSLTLNGNGATLDGSAGAGPGNGLTRVMEIDGSAAGVTVNLDNITLKNGNSAGYHDNGYGGGLLVFGYNGTEATVTLANSTVSGNTSAYDGGGIYIDGEFGSAALTITGSTLTNNTAGAYSSSGVGGAITNHGTDGSASLTVSSNTSITGNSASQNSNGIFNYDGALYLGVAGDTTFSINDQIRSDTYSTITVAPGITTINVNAPLENVYYSTVSSSAATVNIGAGSGLENGYLVQGGVSLAGDGGTVKLTAGTTYNLDATTGEIVIGQDLTFNGNGATIDGSAGAGSGNGTTRVMEIDGSTGGVTVNLNNVTLKNGNGADLGIGGSAGTDDGYGGGLLVYGYSGRNATVNLTNSTVSGNTSSNDGGGIYVEGDYGNAALTITGSTISNNTSGLVNTTAGGGGISSEGYSGTASVTISANTSITGNSAPGNGSGVYNNYGALTLGVAGNTTMTVAYPIYSIGSGATITVAPSVATLNVNASVLNVGGSTSSSSAMTVNVGAGSGLENGSVVQGGVNLAAPGATLNLTAGTNYNLDATTGEIVISQDLTLNGNGASIDGSAGAGAGNGTTRVMEVDGSAGGVTVNLNHVTLKNGNGASNGFGAALGTDEGYGGGLLVFGYNTNTATVNLTNSTVSGNTSSYDGGGIYVEGDYGDAALTATGSTISNNTAGVVNTTASGGGIYSEGYGGTASVTITSSTLTGNSAPGNGAGIVSTYGALNLNFTGSTATIAYPIYLTNNSTFTISPSVTTLNLNAAVTGINGSTLSSSATTVNVGAVSGTESGYVVESALGLLGGNGTVNLAASATYNFDATTDGLQFNGDATVVGNGATLNGQNSAAALVLVNSGAIVTLSNMTLTGATGAGLYNGVGGTLTANGVTLTGNGSTQTPYYTNYGYGNPYGGIYNNGTLQLGAGTTVTGNTGYYTGGIFNDYSGTITGMVTNAQVHGNTATQGTPEAEGSDLYNQGTGTYEYTPDGGTGTTSTITGSAYSTGAGAAIVVDPSVTTLVVNAPVNIYNSATVTSTVPVVNIGPGSGTNNASLIQGGITLAGSGATVNLTSSTTYYFDNTTSNLEFNGTLTLAGHGATLNGQSDVGSDLTVNSGADVTLTNMTITGGAGVGLYNSNGGTLTVNGVTITGNGSTQTQYYANYGYGTPYGGIYNNGTLQLGAGTTVTGNTGYYTGGIFNDSSGVINGVITTAQVFGNTATQGTSSAEGSDFYNQGTGTYEYLADGGTGTTSTLNGSTYSYGTGAAIILDPSVTTLNVDAPVNIYNGATVSGSAHTVNIGAGNVSNNAGLVQGGVALAANGAIVNLTAGTTYLFDGSTGEIKIGQDLTLNGNGAILDGSNGAGPGNGVTRVMEIDGSPTGVTVTLNHVTLENGNAAGPGAIYSGYYGGALYIYAENGNQATVTMNNSTVSGSAASYSGGGIYIDGYNVGNASLTLNNSSVTGNSVFYGDGGGIYNDGSSGGNATLTVNNTTISGNTAANGYGGGVYNNGSSGNAVLAGSGNTVTGNSGYENGGIYNSGTITTQIPSTHLYGNTATDAILADVGADFYNVGTGTFTYEPDGGTGTIATINAPIYSSGAGAAIIVAPAITQLNVNAPVTVLGGATVTSSALTANVGAGSGTNNGGLIQGATNLVASGGTVNLLTNATYELDNSSGEILIGQSLTLNGNGSTIDGSAGAGPGNGVTRVMEIDGTAPGVTVTLNHLTMENGNAAGLNANSPSNGGALLIYAENGNQATVTINNSTFSGSTANSYYGSGGGGVNNDGSNGGNATLTLNNCTLTGNSANYYYYSTGGGAVFNDGTNGTATLTVNGGTITGNTGYVNGGIYNTGTILGTITNTQVYGNTVTYTTQSSTGADFYNTGTATFLYKPDNVGGHTATINDSLYSSGSGAVITIDPSVTTIDVNAPVTSTNGATVNGSAATVNIGPGTGNPDNGFLIQSGITLASDGATVNLAPSTTYSFDGSTGGVSLGNDVTLQGHGDTLDGENAVSSLIDISTAQNVTVNNLTAKNASYGVSADYYSDMVNATFNNVTLTGNSSNGLSNYNYYGNPNTIVLNNCTITNNGDSGSGTSAGIYNYYNGSITLNNCTISGNGSPGTTAYSGGIVNSGTLTIDNPTTVTGNTGYYAGGIYNNGTILGTVTSTQVHGNTSTNPDLTNAGMDFYNSGTATFIYKPDGEGSNLTITNPIYSTGTGAVITLDPSLTGTLNLDTQFVSTYSATFNSMATTVNVNAPVLTAGGVFNSAASVVNVAAGSGTENGYYAQAGVAFANSGATVNFAPSATYDFDNTTAGLSIANNLTLQGHGSILDGQGVVDSVIQFLPGGQTATLDNLTVQNGYYGITVGYYTGDLAVTLNNVTATGNIYTGIQNYDYASDDTLNLNNCTISNNGSLTNGSAAGIYNSGFGTVNLTNCTISGNTSNDVGGIVNSGTLTLDSATTVTGNTGNEAGGIYNNGTILGTVTSTHVHGNTATDFDLSNSGSDFYNAGTGTFVYEPDGEPNHSLTISNPIYSSGSTAVITVDPSLTGTLNLNTPFSNTYGSTFNSSATAVNVNAPVVTRSGIFNSAATTVNVAAGSGTENGYYVQAGVAFAGSGATVNLAANATYNFDNTTGQLNIANNLTLQGNGAIFDAQGTGIDLIDLTGGAQAVTVNNLTLQNGSTGISIYTNADGLNATFNHVTVTGNSYGGISDYNYDFANTLNLINDTISNNGASGGNVGGITGYYNSTINLTANTITGNGNSTNPTTAGGITNYGTLSLDSATTVTGNTGLYTGGIYNTGTIIGPVTSTQVHGNTATNTDPTNVGTDFYNTGAGTFVYKPDGEPNHNLTITTPIYSSGSQAVITIDPSLTGTLIINSPITSQNSATFNSSATTVTVNAPANTSSGLFNSAATTVNVMAGSGTENGTYAQTGVALVGSGGTVSLSTGATYNFDNSTGGLIVNHNLVLQGHGATLNGQGISNTVLQLSSNNTGTETVNNLTVENGYNGVSIVNNLGVFTATLNNLTITGNTYTGLFNENDSDIITVNNSTITNNGTVGSSGLAGGVFNYYDEMLTLTNCTISNNGSSTFAPTAGGLTNYGILNLTKTSITGNTGSTAGGIYNVGTITDTDSSMSGNTSTTAADDVYNAGTYTAIADANATVPNTINYTTSDYNSGTATFLANTINWNKAFTNNGTLTLDPTMGSVTINQPIVNTGGTLLIQAPVITLNASISSTQGDIVLVDTQQFVNNDGASALSATNGYTWQVWSVNPPTSGQSIVDQDGGLTPNFIQYNATYGVTSPAASGNGLLYSDTVGLQVALTGVATKIYDGTTMLSLAPQTYSLNATGALNGDTVNVSASSTLTGTLNTKDVDTANTATFDPAQVNFNVVSQNGVAIYGYTLQPFSAPASVTPASVTAALNFAVPEAKTYDGTTAATLASNGYSLSGVLGGDSLSLTASSGTYSNPHVGSSKSVTYTGLAITPNGATDASDYTLNSSSLSGNLGTINPATLTAGLIGTVIKTYDATTTATLTTGNYTLAGVIGTDTVTLNDPATGTYDTANVGTGKTVTVTSLAIAGPNAGDYTLASTMTSGPVGEIDPSGVQMSLTGTLGGTITKVYDSTTTASNLTAANYVLTGVMPGDTVILSGPTTGTYAQSGVGTGILVTSSPGLSLSGAQASNYVLTNNQASGNIGIITPATLTITATNDSKTYNAQPYSGGAGVSYSGFEGTDSATSLAGTLTYSGTSQGAVNAGNYTITPGGYTVGNYTYVYNSGSLSVRQAALTVTADNLSKVYGAFDPSPTYTVTGLLGTDTSNVISSVSLTTNTGSAATAGTHPIIVTTGTAQNYAITDVNGTLTVTPATLTITANNDTTTYNNTSYSGDTQGVTYSGFQYTDSAASLPGTLTYSGTSQGAFHAGTYSTSPGGYTAGNYTYVYASGSLMINPATLTAALTGTVAKTYDATTTATLTSGNYTLMGVIGTDTVTLNDPTSGTYDTANVGTGKTVTVTGLAISGSSASDYTLASTMAAGPVGVINAAGVQMSLTGTLGGTVTKVYDSTTTANNLTPANYVLTGVMPGDTVILNGPTTGTYASASVGTGILVTSSPGLSLTGAQASNYVLTNNQASGNIGIITPATLTITANNDSKTYDATAYSGGAGVSYAGFAGTDSATSLAGALTYSGTSQGAVNTGSYVITPGGYTAGNYTYIYNSGSLAISQAALTVTANNQSKVYGAVDPGLTYGVTGLLGNDTASVITGVGLSTTTGATATAGTHPILTTGGTAQNYTVADVNGTLTVAPATLTITANNDSKTYDATAYSGDTQGVTYSGFQYTDNAASLPGTLTYSGTSQGAVNAGNYTITPGGYTAGNYTYAYTSGNLAITPAQLLVTANAATINYTANAFTGGAGVNVTGFKGSDSVTSLAGGLTYSGTSQGAVNVGTYTIVPGGYTSNNYTFNYQNAALTIDQAALTVTANNQSKTYGGADPTLTFGVTGLVGSDTASVLTGVGLTTVTGANATAGTHAIVVTGGTAQNYTVVDANGTLTVTPATLTITANNDSKTYDATAYSGDPQGVAYSGFQYADSASSLPGTLTYSGTSQGAVNAGNYTITPGGYTAGNYTYVYNGASLAIGTARLVVTANADTTTYSATPFTGGAGVSYSGLQGTDTGASLPGTLTYSGTSQGAINVGSYTITPGGYTAGNYTYTYNSNALTINQAPLSINVTSTTITPGSDLPAFNATYTGFVGSDTASILGGTLTYQTTAPMDTPAGVYPVTATGVYDPTGNYAVNIVDGTLTIANPVTTTTPSTSTGGAASAGSNLVPPVLAASAPTIITTSTTTSSTTQQPSDPTPVTKPAAPASTAQDSSSSLPPPPISFIGAGTALPPVIDAGGLASSSGNTGQVANGDIAQISNGQLNNAANPHAAGIMNQALGPAVRQNLSDALQISVDWTADTSATPATGDETADTTTGPTPGETGKHDEGETILTGGDVAEMNNTGVKNIPLSQAPIALQNAMNGDLLKGMAASH